MFRAISLSLAVLLIFFSNTAFAGEIPTDASEIMPIKSGTVLPAAILYSPEGESVSLQDLTKGKKSLVIFYRGGWCPYCNAHLGELRELEEELKGKGFQILALSPDRPEKVKEARAEQNINYLLYSDSKMRAAKAFGVAFQLDKKTVGVYKNDYGIDLEADSGESHHLLPVPSAFVVNEMGKVVFAHSNSDYKVRISKDEIRNAIQ